MTTFDYDLVCIGSGPAGQRGAVQAAKLGKRVAIVERHGTLGGICLDMGTIPSKTFREAVVWTVEANARTTGSMAQATRQRPSAEVLLARVASVVQREATVIANQLHRNGVDGLSGEAAFADPHRLRILGPDGTREVTTANVLIATGTVAAPVPGRPADGDAVITSDDICQLTRLPKTLTVVGAGVIGIEYASMFAAL